MELVRGNGFILGIAFLLACTASAKASYMTVNDSTVASTEPSHKTELKSVTSPPKIFASAIAAETPVAAQAVTPSGYNGLPNVVLYILVALVLSFITFSRDRAS